jgi:hypothetical protein
MRTATMIRLRCGLSTEVSFVATSIATVSSVSHIGELLSAYVSRPTRLFIVAIKSSSR